VAELAKIAFANMRDFWPTEGETLDLSRLDPDRTAAIEEVDIDEAIDTAGTLHRRVRVKLHDKLGALTSLARHLGMFVDRHFVAGSIEAKVMAMTPEERVARAQEILEGARKLPLLDEYEREQAKKAKAGS
jgi:phage terminase small subunit